KGEGLGNKFLSHIREVDAIVHVVRCFEDGNVVHVDGTVDPKRDVQTINTELLLSDIETAQKRLDRSAKAAKSGDKQLLKEVDFCKRVLEALNNGTPARLIETDEDEAKLLKDMFLLTAKPVIYAANIAEDDMGKPVSELAYASILAGIAKEENAGIIAVSAKVEEELSSLTDDEKTEFLKELGVDKSGLDKLITASYSLLNLISFLTAGEKETRAWTIKKGTKAPQAAGKIHTDFERGFIRAEVISYEKFMEFGTIAAAKEAGQYRLEGKDYVVADGDVIVFRFNV
ncbi:MAG: redox-regulated ATPase YchF, partial [Clostridia bacterium]|nr:redox-regulated ATPase YchF [Clostridia bacterium]